MNTVIKEIIDKKEKEQISKEVLYDLPEWFGLPESTENYIKDSQDKPFLACYADNEITNEFYIAMGYKELECFPTLWDEWNPCQIYIKYLGK